MKDYIPTCASCPFKLTDRICRKPDGKYPKNCPTVLKEKLSKKSMELLNETGLFELAKQSAIQEGDGYTDKHKGYDFIRPIKPRIQEIWELAEKMGYKRIGLAFCIGVRKEAQVVEALFKKRGFEVASVCCKVGCVPKEDFGLRDDQKIVPGSFESICNPALQALVLNEVGTDLNILLGLCVGHDTIFLKFSEALCTVLAVKDRVLAHNPLAAIYQIDSYYRWMNHSTLTDESSKEV